MFHRVNSIFLVGSAPVVAGLLAGFSAAPAAAQSSGFPACDRFPVGEETYACECPANAAGAVWGSGPYTSDSNVCAAALHQGVIPASGGAVLALGMPGQESYDGSTANGIETNDWGSYGSSFIFEPKGPRATSADLAICDSFDTTQEIVECSCPAGSGDGSVWGNSPYTADSDICTAAMHTGVIGTDGGAVRVLRTGGLEAYAGSELNGVTTREWGSYGTSFVFDWN